MKCFFLLMFIFVSSALFSQDSRGSNTSDFPISISTKTSGEFYYLFVDDQHNSDYDESGGINLNGRNKKIDYEIQPVYMVSLEAWARWNFLQITGEYKTNRVFKGGGSVEHDTGDVDHIANNDNLSEILKFGIEAFNLETSYRAVQFDFGSYKVIDVEQDTVLEKNDNFKINMQETDIRYKLYLNPKGSNSASEYYQVPFFFFGYRYVSYKMPRIVYKLMEDPNKEEGNYLYAGETDIQDMDFNLHYLGAGFDITNHYAPWSVCPLFLFSMYVGSGQSDFVYDDEDVNTYFISMHPKFGLGASYQPFSDFFHSSFKLMWEINLFGNYAWDTSNKADQDFAESNDNSSNTSTTQNPDDLEYVYSFGGFEVYHTLTFSFEMRF